MSNILIFLLLSLKFRPNYMKGCIISVAKNLLVKSVNQQLPQTGTKLYFFNFKKIV